MTPLEIIIRNRVAAQGPISLAAYMDLALQHPDYGYYRVREPLGRTGDFITAPEVSQLFGEMIGVWCAEAWRNLGQPVSFALVELGPGKGTMMADIMRATAHVGGFHHAKSLYLIESDAKLRARQTEKLAPYRPQHIQDIAQIAAQPLIIVANEFFDAIPVRQFEKTFQGWAEKMVGIEKDALSLTLRLLSEPEKNMIPAPLREARPGTIYEFAPKAQSMLRDLGCALAAQKGAALIIDYGYSASSGASTVQAVSQHKYANIFESPGEIDLTAHVDFTLLSDLAKEAKLQVADVTGQGAFLKNLGIKIRADALKLHAAPAQITDIDKALDRLIGYDQMGELFKVLQIRS